MKKCLIFLPHSLLFILHAYAQFSSSVAYSSKVYSFNKKYYIESVPYDGNFPSSRGKSLVSDSSGMIYSISRAFDMYPDNKYTVLAISNDGQKVIYISSIPYYRGFGFDEEPGLEQNKVVIYKKGRLYQSFTLKEFTGCDEMKEACGNILYDNFKSVIDNKKSTYNVSGFQAAFKENTPETEKFLFRNNFLNINDTIYVVDSRKMVTVYDLDKTRILKKAPFATVYSKMKKFKLHPIDYKRIAQPSISIDSLTKVGSNEPLCATIEKLSGYRYIPTNHKNFYQFGLYQIRISGFLNRNGRFEIKTIQCDKELPKQRIIEYLDSAIFNAKMIPSNVAKVYSDYFFGGFTFQSDEQAAKLRIVQDSLRKKRYADESNADYINEVYIPKNMKECMTELDRLLNFSVKQRLKNAKPSDDFNGHFNYHENGLLLGMWIRNNWGLHQQSKLYKYFQAKMNLSEKEPWRPERISGTIINTYEKWLKGNKAVVNDWYKKNQED